MVAFAGAVLLVIVMNRNHKVDVWFFHRFPQTNVLWVMLVSGVSAAVIVWVLLRVRRVLRELREVRGLRAKELEDRKHRERERMLRETENRIDQKLKQVVEQPAETSDED